jgi:cell division protein FtsB
MLSENGKTITMLKAKAARAIRDVIKLQADLAFAQKACQTLVEENTQLKARLGLEQTILVHRRTL